MERHKEEPGSREACRRARGLLLRCLDAGDRRALKSRERVVVRGASGLTYKLPATGSYEPLQVYEGDRWWGPLCVWLDESGGPFDWHDHALALLLAARHDEEALWGRGRWGVAVPAPPVGRVLRRRFRRRRILRWVRRWRGLL
jgi:hypothetical protein